MSRENEELEEVCQNLEGQEVLLDSNEELLRAIAEQSRQIKELCQQLETERQKWQLQQKQKEDLVEYYIPQFQLLINENIELTKALNELNRSSPILNPASQTGSCYSSTSSSSTSSDCNREDERQLELFLSDSAQFGVECKPETVVRKLEVVKGFVLREREKMKAKMRSIKEEAKREEALLHEVIKEREELLKSTKRQFVDVKEVFNSVGSKLSLQVDRLQADLDKEKKENLRLRNSAVDSTPPETSTSNTFTPLFESTINYGKSPNSSTEKRKINQSDGVEVSKKLKISKDLFNVSSHDHESVKDSENYSKHRIMVLERVLSKQTSDLKNVLAYSVKLQQALTKINMDKTYISEREKEVFPYTGMDQAPHWTTTEKNVTRSPPVSPITREDAILFSSVVEYQLATFSEMHYRNAFQNTTFLVHKPIGMDNPGGTFCYMNSVVQALSSIPVFAVNLICGVESNKGSLLYALYQIYRHVWVRRPDVWNNNHPASLNPKEIRSYYAQNHGLKFDPTKQHDAQEFLEDLIINLERETFKFNECAEQNCITIMFRGYIIAPDGTKEYFRNLRLSIEDESIDSVENALLYHLAYWSPKPPPRDVPGSGNFSAASTSKVDQIGHLQGPNVITTDHSAKPTSHDSVETVSTSKETIYSAAYQNAHSVQDCRSADNRTTKKSTKIYTPDILCISLNRHKIDYSFNFKVLPAEDLIIPADLRAPEGTKIPAHYKLMSIVQYVPIGRSAGHYYTFVMSGNGNASMINDSFLTCVEMSKSYLAGFEGRSSIFIYAKEHEILQRSSGSN